MNPLNRSPQPFATVLRRGAIAVAVSLALVGHAGAQSTISEASALSALPIAVSVAAPVMILSAGATLVVVAVEATSTGTIWVLERASDGARASVRLVGQGIAGASLAAGVGEGGRCGHRNERDEAAQQARGHRVILSL